MKKAKKASTKTPQVAITMEVERRYNVTFLTVDVDVDGHKEDSENDWAERAVEYAIQTLADDAEDGKDGLHGHVDSAQQVDKSGKPIGRNVAVDW